MYFHKILVFFVSRQFLIWVGDILQDILRKILVDIGVQKARLMGQNFRLVTWWVAAIALFGVGAFAYQTYPWNDKTEIKVEVVLTPLPSNPAVAGMDSGEGKTDKGQPQSSKSNADPMGELQLPKRKKLADRLAPKAQKNISSAKPKKPYSPKQKLEVREAAKKKKRIPTPKLKPIWMDETIESMPSFDEKVCQSWDSSCESSN